MTKNKLFLMNEEEYKNNKEFIPTESAWWLRSHSIYLNNNYVHYVSTNGNVYSNYAYFGNRGVRPAFKFTSDIFDDRNVGSLVHYGKLIWVKLNDGIYLSKDVVFNYRFDNKSNDYNTSDIKKKLEEYELLWFTENELSMLDDWSK